MAAILRSRPGTGGRYGPWEVFIKQLRAAVVYANATSNGRRYQVIPVHDSPDGKSPYFGAIGTGARVTRLS